MKLETMDIQEFKEKIYPEYVKLFPPSERKSYHTIEKSVRDQVMNLLKIVVEDQIVGFIITNSLANNPYLQLDYLGIFETEQKKGYGSDAILLLKENSKEFSGIFIEIEKPGWGENEKENLIRQKRAAFYKSLGFQKLKFDVELYHVRYETYLLPCTPKPGFSDEEIIEKIFEIYVATIGEKRTQKYCKVMEDQ